MNQENKQKIEGINSYLPRFYLSSIVIFGLAIVAIIIMRMTKKYPSGFGGLHVLFGDAAIILCAAAAVISIIGIILSIKFVNKNIKISDNNEVSWMFIFILAILILFLATIFWLGAIVTNFSPWVGLGVIFSPIVYFIVIIYMNFFIKQADLNRRTIFLSVLTLILSGQLAIYIMDYIHSGGEYFRSYFSYALTSSIIPNLFIFIFLFLPVISISLVRLNQNFLNQEVQEISKE